MSADLMRGDGRIHQITAFTTVRTINTDVQRCQGGAHGFRRLGFAGDIGTQPLGCRVGENAAMRES